MNINLTGRKAVVTGSTAGIGRAIAEGLARAGASVVISGRGEERVAAALRELRKLFPQVEFTGVTADLATAKGAADLFARAPDADILVNNVGTGRPKPFFEIDDSEWVALFELNVMSGIRAARHYVPNMTKRGWGRVVFISSESALAIPKDMIDYANDIAEGKVYMMNTEESHASLFSRRRLIINCAIATAGLSFTGMAGAQETPVRTQLDKAPDPSITLQIYKGFSQNRLDL